MNVRMLIIAAFLLLPCTGTRLALADPLPVNDAAFVEVGKSDVDFAGKPSGEINAILWNKFAVIGLDQRFNKSTTENWRDKLVRYQDALLFNAAQQGMDVESLKKCLSVPVEGKNKAALVPVAAMLTRSAKDDVWVIVYVWEYTPKDQPMLLSHVAVKAMRAKNQSVVGQVNCM